MRNTKLIGILVTLLLIVSSGYAKLTGLSIYAKPGAALLSGSVGFHGRIGTQIDVKDIFGADEMTDALYTGVVFDVGFANQDVISIFNFAFGLDVGYDIDLFNDLLTITPSTTLGMGIGNIENTNLGVSRNLSFYVNPILSVDFNINKNMKTGIQAGFPMYFHNTFVRYLYVGASFTYRIEFGGASKTTKKMKEDIGDKSEVEDITSLSFYDETTYITDLPEGDDIENYNKALKEVHEAEQFLKKSAFDLNHLATNIATLLDESLEYFPTDPTEAVLRLRQMLKEEGVEISVTIEGFEETEKYVIKIDKPKKPSKETEELINKYNSLIEDYISFEYKAGLIEDRDNDEIDKLINAASIFFTDDYEIYMEDVVASLENAKTVYEAAPATIEELSTRIEEVKEMIEALDEDIELGQETEPDDLPDEANKDFDKEAELSDMINTEMDNLSEEDDSDDVELDSDESEVESDDEDE